MKLCSRLISKKSDVQGMIKWVSTKVSRNIIDIRYQVVIKSREDSLQLSSILFFDLRFCHLLYSGCSANVSEAYGW